MNTKILGNIGEAKAEAYLKECGYKILERNYRAKFGEIDLIAEKDKVITFVEVKSRANKSFGIEVAELAGVSKDVTDRAKIILKKLENSDITKNNKSASALLNDGDDLSKTKLTEVEQIISEIDMNNLSPMQAFNILNDLNEKIKG